MKTRKAFIKLMLCVLSAVLLTQSRVYGLSFGKNRPRVDNLQWYVADTEHFNIYHYPQAEAMLTDVSFLAEEAYDWVTGILGYNPLKKSPFLFYLSQNQFEQNNIAEADQAGGFSEPIKNRFVLPATGSERQLRHVVFHEFTHDVCFYMWYEGTWKTASLLKAVFYPLWIIEGVAEYASAQYDDISYAEMVMRDAVISDRIIPLTDLQNFGPFNGYQTYLAYKESESAVRYIAEKYGSSTVNDMLAIFRESIDVNTVLSRTVKNNLTGFDREWREHLKEKYEKMAEDKDEAEAYGDKITSDNQFNTNPGFSADGKKVAYISDRGGYNEIFIMNGNGTRNRPVLKWRIGSRLDYVYREGHALSWSKKNEIAFAGRKNYRDFICIFNVNKRTLKKIEMPFDHVYSPCFSGDGSKVVFAGLKEGTSDLWLYEIEKNTLTRLTFDDFCDDYPAFSPDDKKIIWVSERNLQKDLWVYSFEGRQVTRLTDTAFHEIQPAWVCGKIYFVCDPDGFYNLYCMDEDGSNIKKLTNVKTGIFTPVFNNSATALAFVYYRNGEKNIYICDYIQGLRTEDFHNSGRPQGESRGKEEKRITRPQDITPVTNISRYRFKPSTDILLPIGYFDYDPASKDFNYYAFVVWYLSDMMGDHNLSIEYLYGNDWYADNLDMVNVNLTYLYKKYRPQFGFNFNDISSIDSGNGILERDARKLLFLEYPFGKFSRMGVGAGIFNGYSTNMDSGQLITGSGFNYHLGSVSFIRDTTQGKLFDILSGHRCNLTIEKSFKAFGGDYDYSMLQVEAQKYFTLRNYRLNDYHVFAMRFWGGLIRGENRKLQDIQFNIEDPSLLRGISGLIATGNSAALLNLELRMMILPEIDYHIWFFWPDIYIKNLQLVMFLDSGRTWTDTDTVQGIRGFKTSVGTGIRLNMLMLEQYPIVLRLDYAAQLDDFSNKEITLMLGPTF